MSQSGGEVQGSYFDEQVYEPSRTRLAAVVLVRRAPRPPVRATLAERVRSVAAGLRRPKTAPYEFTALPEGWDSATGTGDDAVLFSRERRLLRVAGVDYPVPAGEHTFVLLIDRNVGEGGAPSVVSRLVDVPTAPYHDYDRSLTKEANLKRCMESFRTNPPVWMAALEADPVVGYFMRTTPAI
jgi:hypothetical protein